MRFRSWFVVAALFTVLTGGVEADESSSPEPASLQQVLDELRALRSEREAQKREIEALRATVDALSREVAAVKRRGWGWGQSFALRSGF